MDIRAARTISAHLNNRRNLLGPEDCGGGIHPFKVVGASEVARVEDGERRAV